MHNVAVCDRGEYGNRLVSYLQNICQERYRIYRFTGKEAFSEQDMAFDLCIVDEDMYKEDRAVYGYAKRVIRISHQEKEHCFCRYHAPKLLVEWIDEELKAIDEEQLSMEADEELQEKEGGGGRIRTKAASIIGVFMPIHVPDYMELIQSLIHEGEEHQKVLVLSMEDMNYVGDVHPNMTDLCYYIHLREEPILERIHQFAIQKGECDWISDSEIYLDLGELTMEDYRWFFTMLREQKEYDKIVVAFGFAAASRPEFFTIYDKIIQVHIEGHLPLEKLLERTSIMIEKSGIAVESRTFHKIQKG